MHTQRKWLIMTRYYKYAYRMTKYMQNDSAVYGCFLDASKAFDLVNHEILFKRLMGRKLPTPVLRLLMAWYREQRMRVKWNQTLSEPFSVSNGVRQGEYYPPYCLLYMWPAMRKGTIGDFSKKLSFWHRMIALCELYTMVQVSNKYIEHKWSYGHFYALG